MSNLLKAIQRRIKKRTALKQLLAVTPKTIANIQYRTDAFSDQMISEMKSKMIGIRYEFLRMGADSTLCITEYVNEEDLIRDIEQPISKQLIELSAMKVDIKNQRVGVLLDNQSALTLRHLAAAVENA